jgi:ATP synthase F1 complex assembly factor 1
MEKQKETVKSIAIEKEKIIETKLEKKSSKGGVYCKSLDDILDVEKIKTEPKDKIETIWNTFHSSRDALSAALDASLYKSLSKRGKEFPMFVLPLPRDDGYEMYFLQFQGDQVYFTPLVEYQLNRENARPSFSITFYNELMKEKDIVLMLGELDQNCSIKLKDAQHLVYQLQLFYLTGSQEQTGLVEKFNKNPSQFDYHEQIKMLTKF